MFRTSLPIREGPALLAVKDEPCFNLPMAEAEMGGMCFCKTGPKDVKLIRRLVLPIKLVGVLNLAEMHACSSSEAYALRSEPCYALKGANLAKEGVLAA